MWGQLKEWIKNAVALAKRIAALESRITALEARFERQPPSACPFCGELAMRRIPADSDGALFGSGGSHPYMEEVWACEKCSKEETRRKRL
jgi:hypothetical protein